MSTRPFVLSLTLVCACAPSSPGILAHPIAVDAGAPVSSTPPIAASALASTLAGAALDVQHLPSLDALGPTQLDAVMRTFDRALGLTCIDCHQPNAYDAPTPRTRVAAKMWDRLVRGLAFTDGRPLYCDSCHHGRVIFLDRSDDSALSRFMQTSFVDPLSRTDGHVHDCATCHGEPFAPSFLDGWEATD